MAGVIRNWADVLRTQNLSGDRPLDPISRWLLITRASVFPMTITSVAIGGLLTVAGPTATHPSWLLFAEALLGCVLAHAANNMINDWFDVRSGLDSAEYVRGQYAPHPILSGLVSERGLLAAIALVNAIDLAILVHLAWLRGPAVVAFALAGLFVSVFYVAPPLKLKHRGLGEPGVFLVWGPLMIGGTYYVTAGSLPSWVLAASLPYAALVASVLIGKHVDKLEADQARGVRTLPVLLGDGASRRLVQSLFVAFFALVAGLVAFGIFGLWTLLVALAVPRLVRVLRVFREPRPASPPADYPIWPLWYVAWSFVLTRLAGALLVAGLLANAIYPVFVRL